MTIPADYLAEHQLTALNKLHNGMILSGGVGTGKSRVAAAYYKENEAPRAVYVITTARKRDDFDWQEEFYKLGIGPASGPVSIPRVPKASRKGTVVGQRGESSASSNRLRLQHRLDDARESEPGHNDVRLPALAQGDSARNGRGDAVAAGGSIELRGTELSLRKQGDDEKSHHGTGGGSLRGRDGGNTSDDGSTGRHSMEGSESLDPGQAGIYPYVLTVDSWNNINKYADVEGALFIFDEQRLVGSGLWSKAFLRISRRNRWILLTATPGDTWLDYVPVFIANGFYKNRSEFKREHVVYNTFTRFPKVERYINQGRLIRQRKQLLVHMPYERHTVRQHVEVLLKYDKEMLHRVVNDRWHVYEERPLNDVSEMFSVMRKVVNSDPSRLEMVCTLWEIHPRLIIFYNFDYELESLRSLEEYYGLTETKPGTSSSMRSSGRESNSSSSLLLPGSSMSTTSKSSTPTISSLTSHSPQFDARLGTTNTGIEKSSASSLRPGLMNTGGLLLPSSVRKSSSIGMATSSSIHGTAGLGSTSSTQTVKSSQPYILDRRNSRPGSESLIDTATGTRQAIASSNTSTISTTTSIDGSRSSGDEGFPQAYKSTDTPSVSIAEWNGHKHEPVPTTDRWLYLVQYAAGAEAWNCITTDAMIKYSRNYSWKTTEQAEGRFDRLNTPFKKLWCYDFTTDSAIDTAIGRSLKSKQTFNEAAFARIFKK